MRFGHRGKQKKPTPIGTPQGRHTLISLLGCAILGMVLSRVLPFLIGKLRPNMKADEAEEIGVLIALGISGIVLVISLLRPRESVSPLRKQLLKEQEKSDGR
jgi:galactitol-specific phosphotransferase system IIC component